MRTKNFSLFMSVFTFFLIIASGAQAIQEITPQKAGEIQKVFQQKFDKLIQGSGSSVRLEGTLLVEPTETYYAVTFPQIFVDLPDGRVTDYGIVALNLVPDIDPTKWLVSMALPTEISTKDKNGVVIARARIGTQQFSGTWNTKMGWFQALKSQMGNLILTDTETNVAIKLDSLSIDGTNEPGLDSEKLNAIGQIELQGVSAVIPESKGAIKKNTLAIDTINMTYDIADLDFSVIDQMNKLVEQAESDEFSVPLGPDFSEMETQFSLQAMTVRDPKGKQSFKMDSMTSQSTYAIREEGLMDADTQFDLFGMTSDPNDRIMQWMPSDMSSHITISNFPSQDFTKMILKWGKEQMDIGMVDEEKGLQPQDLARLPLLPDVDALKSKFVEAGTEYQINRFAVKTPIGAGIDLNGQVVATEGAPYIMVGQFALALTGLDIVTSTLQQKISESTLAPAEEGKPKDVFGPMIAQQALMGVMMVQGFGKTEKTLDGKSVTRLDINLPRDGGILVNGQDIGMLMGMMGGSKQPEE